MLTSGTRITVPAIWDGSSRLMSFSIAMMEVYSVPWAPETRARTGPRFSPLMTMTGIFVAASTPAGTSKYPVDFCPGAAEAVPIEKDEACAWTRSGNNRHIQEETRVVAKDVSIDPPWGGRGYREGNDLSNAHSLAEVA